MCGFLYTTLKTPNENFSSIFKQALKAMEYRGADALGFHQEENHYFGHARLSILDLSDRSNQPVVTKNKILLFNGEIYNFKKLVNNAHSDTLALSTMLENEEEITGKLSGMYAVLVFDKATQMIQVTRDFYGEKPVYYYADENIFIVSSTIKSITLILEKTCQLKLNINQLSIYEYLLCGYVREPRTIYENIKMLNSGHQLNFSADWDLRIKNVFPALLSNSSLSSAEYAEKCVSTSDVQPALLLSSGVDSNYVLSIMKKAAEKFKIFTYKASSEKQDESNDALKNLRQICGDQSVEADVIENHADMLKLYQDYPALLEQPTSDGMNLFNILAVSREYDKESKLVILGTGGDELFGGYKSFSNFKKVSFLRQKLVQFKKWLPKKYARFFELSAAPAQFVESYYFLYRICHQFLSLIPKKATEQLFSEFVSTMGQCPVVENETPYEKIKRFETFDYMRNQLLRDSDNISLFCGYEARNPLLSIRTYFFKPDNKKSLKQELKQKHQLKFMRKRGFTFCEQEKKVASFLYQKIVELNDQYRLLSEKALGKVLNLQRPDFSLLRKIYVLLAWLDANEVEVGQLGGVMI